MTGRPVTDLVALRARMKELLPPSEQAQLNRLFDRLERERKATADRVRKHRAAKI